ncbi:MAG TPA: carboxypeptidase-like regulatory domain-containing protein [Candidatus Sulfotelmatobacter sp.]|jgi:hypothetical protein|nr:carboxypeptidase-like regulatory domain-containing protein [Candidatus Sulfotelmatobacter sp.]
MKLGKLLYKISVVLLAIVSTAPWAIGQSTFGGIVGVVKDPSQGVVVAAELTLTNLDDHSERKASADGNGGFEFINLSRTLRTGGACGRFC